MKRILLSLLVVFLTQTNIAPTFAVAAEEYSLAIGEWAPYVGEKLDGYGFAAEIVTAVLKEMDGKPKYSFVPWARAEGEALDGVVVGTFPWSVTDERKNKGFMYTETFVFSRERLFYLKAKTKSVSWEKLEELKPYKIGGTKAYMHMQLFKDAGITLDEGSNDEMGFKKLEAGRIDYFPSDELVGWGLIKQLFPGREGEFAATDKVTSQSAMAIMLPKNKASSQVFADKFNKALVSAKAKGVTGAIYKKYNIKE